MAKRPYTPAQAAANARYDAKTYDIYTIKLRKVDDADIIADIERCKAQGINITEYLRRLYRLK